MPIEALALGAVILAALVLYALFAGADFGGGVWYLFASGDRKEGQRDLISDAIAPIWEANHVWLVLVVVVLFTAFPPAFAALGTRFHAPLTALLVAIVLRGAAFVFRSAPGIPHHHERRWGRTFSIASMGAAILLGMTVGAIVSGAPAPLRLTLLGPWTSPFALATGLFTLLLFAYLAAVYLTVEAEGELREDFRRRALVSGVLCGVVALLTFLLSGRDAPLVRAGLLQRSWSLVLHGATAAAALLALWALATRRFPLARLAAAAQVGLVVLGWGASQAPYLIVPDITLASASASRATQRLLLYALAVGGLVLFPSLRLLYRIFKPLRAHPRTKSRH
jgi:cytochrome d ubiquinol oxidase subunit II